MNFSFDESGSPIRKEITKQVYGDILQNLIDETVSAPQGKVLEIGIVIAGKMIKQVYDEKICDGVHVMAIGKEEFVPDIMQEAGII